MRPATFLLALLALLVPHPARADTPIPLQTTPDCPPSQVWQILVGKYPYHTLAYHAVAADVSALPPPLRDAIQTVHVGMTRREFAHFFHQANGLSGGPLARATYTSSDTFHGVYLFVTFAAHDPARMKALWDKMLHKQSCTQAELHAIFFGEPQDNIIAFAAPWIYVPVPGAKPQPAH